jgi:hypothetical protein
VTFCEVEERPASETVANATQANGLKVLSAKAAIPPKVTQKKQPDLLVHLTFIQRPPNLLPECLPPWRIGTCIPFFGKDYNFEESLNLSEIFFVYLGQRKGRRLAMLELLLFPFKAMAFLVILPFRILGFMILLPLKLLFFLLAIFLLALLIPMMVALVPLILLAIPVLVVIGIVKLAFG